MFDEDGIRYIQDEYGIRAEYKDKASEVSHMRRLAELENKNYISYEEEYEMMRDEYGY